MRGLTYPPGLEALVDCDPEALFLLARLCGHRPDLGRAALAGLAARKAPPPYRVCPDCEGSGLLVQAVRLDGGIVSTLCDCQASGYPGLAKEEPCPA